MAITRQPTGQDLVCLVCHKGDNIDIDHVVNRGMGGSKARDVPENKVPLCRECHDLKTLGRIETYVDFVEGEIWYHWRKKGAEVTIPTVVEVSQRYKCLVGRLSDGAEEDTGEASPVLTEPSASSLKEESDPVLSAAAESERSDETQRTDFITEKAPGPRSLGPTEGSAAAPSAGLTHDQRVAIAKEICDAQLQRGWRAGDTANQWEEELGEDFWNLYANEFGYTYPSLRNHQRVSRQIPQELRNPHLSHSHHVIVAGLSRLSVVLWLYRCEIEEWPVAEFRRQVKGGRPRVKRWTLAELEQEAQAFMVSERQPQTVNGFLSWITPIG